MCNLNINGRQLSCSINPCIQLHNSPLRHAAHGQDFQNLLWYMMETQEIELDKES